MAEVKERKELVKLSLFQHLDDDELEEQYQDLEAPKKQLSSQKKPTTTPTTTPRNKISREGLPWLPIVSPRHVEEQYKEIETPKKKLSSKKRPTTTPKTTPKTPRNKKEGLPWLPIVSSRYVTPLPPLTPGRVVCKMDTDSINDLKPPCLEDGDDELTGKTSTSNSSRRSSRRSSTSSTGMDTTTPKTTPKNTLTTLKTAPKNTPKTTPETTPKTPRNKGSRKALPPLPIMSPLTPCPVLWKMDTESMKDMVFKTPCLEDGNVNSRRSTINSRRSGICSTEMDMRIPWLMTPEPTTSKGLHVEDSPGTSIMSPKEKKAVKKLAEAAGSVNDKDEGVARKTSKRSISRSTCSDAPADATANKAKEDYTTIATPTMRRSSRRRPSNSDRPSEASSVGPQCSKSKPSRSVHRTKSNDESLMVTPKDMTLEKKLRLTAKGSDTTPLAAKAKKSSQNSVASEPPRRRSVHRTKSNDESLSVTPGMTLEKKLRLTAKGSDTTPLAAKAKKSSQNSVASEPPRRRSVHRTKSNDESSSVTPGMTLEKKLRLTAKGSDTSPLAAKAKKSSQNSVASEPPRRRSVHRTKSNEESSSVSPEDMTLEKKLRLTAKRLTAKGSDTTPLAAKAKKSSQSSVVSEPPRRRSVHRTKSNDESSLVTPDMTLEKKLRLTVNGSDTTPLAAKTSSNIRRRSGLIPLASAESLEEEEERLEQQLRLAAGGNYLAAPKLPLSNAESPEEERLAKQHRLDAGSSHSATPSSHSEFMGRLPYVWISIHDRSAGKRRAFKRERGLEEIQQTERNYLNRADFQGLFESCQNPQRQANAILNHRRTH
jgi:hypothetical protein